MYCCFNWPEFIYKLEKFNKNSNSNQNVIYSRYKMSFNKFNFRITYFNITMKEDLKVN